MHWSLSAKEAELPSDLISLIAEPIEPFRVEAVVRLTTENKEKRAAAEQQYTSSNEQEESSNKPRHFSLQKDNTVIHYPITNFADESTFNFKKVLDVGEPQSNLYELVKPVLTDIFDGYNCAVVSYGESLSGKTYTVFGNDESDGLATLFFTDILQKKREVEAGSNGNITMGLQISVVEVMMEKVYDLLVPIQERKPMKSHHETKKFHLYFQEATKEYISTMKEFDRLIKQAKEHRDMSYQKMDSKRSISHVIIRIELEQLDRAQETVTRSSLTITDLCGSNKFDKEIDSKLGVENIKKLNQSVANVQTVVNTVIQNQSVNKLYTENGLTPSTTLTTQRVPYKESQLTGLLQDVFGGNCRTRMILNCFEDKAHHEETISTLRFGSMVQEMVNFVRADKSGLNSKKKLDVIVDDMKVREDNYLTKIKLLEQEIGRLNKKQEDVGTEEELTEKLNASEDENKKLREQLETLSQLFNSSDPKEAEDNKKIIQTLMEKCEAVAELQLKLEGQLHENSIMKADNDIKSAKVETLETMNTKLLDQLQTQESSSQDVLKSNAILKKELDALAKLSEAQKEKIKILETRLRDSSISAMSSVESSPRKGSISSSSMNTMLPIEETESQSKSWGFSNPSTKGTSFWGSRKVSSSSVTTITSQDSIHLKPLKKGFNLKSIKVNNQEPQDQSSP